MEQILINLFNLSITASYIIIAVLLLRALLFKAPKWISCLMWAVVGIRLALPFSIESILSLVPSAEPIPSDIAMSPNPQIDTGLGILNSAVNSVISESFAPDPTQSATPLLIWLIIASIAWLAGLFVILLWGVISYILVKRKTIPSIKVRENIYICDNISSPFILGFFRPKIYLPSAITDDEAAVVIEHERAHISRLDHIWKPIGFVILAVYWFNPLVWLAYAILCRDIEKACDQKVIKSMSDESRRIYSRTLLSYSTNSVRISACPLAFGEVGVKTRVKSILNYKKPAFWIIIVAILLLVGTAIAFLTYPKSEAQDDLPPASSQAPGEISDDMLPTDVNATGLIDRMMFIPIEGKTYRYKQTGADPNKYTMGDELLNFPRLYTSHPASSIIEKDTVTVYKIKDSDLKRVYVMIEGDPYIYEYYPAQACSSDALEKAKHDGYTVLEDGFPTHGMKQWNDFYNAVTKGKSAEIKLANYYTIDKDKIYEALYEATKDDYPRIYRSSVVYDGKSFTVAFDDGTARKYAYMYKFTETYGEQSAHPGKTYSTYVLTNKKDVTWNEIVQGMTSSIFDDYIDHYRLYNEFTE